MGHRYVLCRGQHFDLFDHTQYYLPIVLDQTSPSILILIIFRIFWYNLHCGGVGWNSSTFSYS